MAAKAILVFCAQALLAQQWLNAGLSAPCGLAGPAVNSWNGLATPGLAGGYGAGCGGVASTGGGLFVTSVSPIAPTGVSVLSENAYEGSLAAGGNLPFLGTITLEGVLHTAGAGAVSYGCGDGAVGIVTENGSIFTGIIVPETFAPAASFAAPDIAGLAGSAGIAGLGYSGINGYGYGGIGCCRGDN